jgi:oxygen-dependent protoporphyrinogen oxidase
MSTPVSLKVAIVGAGISGLTAAYRLGTLAKEANLDIVCKVFDAAESVGGVIRTEKVQDRILEHGPDSWLASKPNVMELIEELGLSDQIISTNETNRRSLIASAGKLHVLPEGFVMLAPSRMVPFAMSSLFSPAGKIRMALDLVSPPKTDLEDETVESFVLRRFGREALTKVVQPMVGGIYVGDVSKLSAKAALPQFTELERCYGSVIKGLMLRKEHSQERTASGARYSMFVTLRDGAGCLVDELKRRIGAERIATGSAVKRLERLAGNRWRVESSSASEDFDLVILATSAGVTAEFLQSVDAALSEKLSKIESASAAVVNLSFKSSDFPKPFNGFGFVIPVTEKRSILAASLISNKFPGRATPDTVAVRAFVGGVLQPELLNSSDAELIELVRVDLEYYLGVKSAPLTVHVNRFPASMPQYNLGHSALVQEIMDDTRARMPGVYLAGNSYFGVGIPDCITTAVRTASAAIEYANGLSKVESVAS